MTAYYNEIDTKKAAWLRELIKRGLIAPGDVDERSIVDVRPEDLLEYSQCHFFAGIGVWRDADWIGCRDGKFRPVEPGTFPLATGATSRVGRLRGYGDAICAPAAQAFIEAYLDAERQ